MTDKQIIGGRGSAKSYTTLNTIEVMLENEKLTEALKAKEQECEELNEELYYWVNGEYCDNKCNVVKELDQLKQTLTEIKEIAEAHKKDESVWNPYRQLDIILQKISECEGNDE